MLSILFLSVGWPLSANSQTVQEAIEFYQNGNVQKARESFLKLVQEYPDDAEVLFYSAELEPSADRALEYRQRFLSLYPHHDLADKVLYGVAQYHFAVGYYLTAAKDYGQLLSTYSQSDLRAEALYWLASSKLAIGAADSASFYFQKLTDQHSGSAMVTWAQLGLIDAAYLEQNYSLAQSRCRQFIDVHGKSPLAPIAIFRLAEICDALGQRQQAIELLERLVTSYPNTYQGKDAQRQLTEWGGPDVSQAENQQITRGTYSVQVGAFSERMNALNLEAQLHSWGYLVEIVKTAGRHRTLYLVWVGRYESREEASKEAKRLEQDRGLPYQIIQR